MTETLPEQAETVLDVRDLSVSFRTADHESVRILDRVSLTVHRGETVGLVGESGSGKSLTSLAIMSLLPRNLSLEGGSIMVCGDEVTSKKPRELRRIRGSRISMILQDPMSSLDPSFTVGNQMGETLRLHKGLKGSALERECVRLLKRLRVPHPEKVLSQFPHQLSGGMRQRVCSAIALSGEPELLIADEPTTALDVTTQAQYLDLLSELQEENGFALILITHDLAVLQEICHRLIVMYAGQVVEEGPLHAVLEGPDHPYTRALLAAVPRLDAEDLRPIDGQSPDPQHFPLDACRFSDRCAFVRPSCRSATPALSARAADRAARCFGTEAEGWIEDAEFVPGSR